MAQGKPQQTGKGGEFSLCPSPQMSWIGNVGGGVRAGLLLMTAD